MTLRPIQWQVIDGNICLTGDGYADLSANMAEIVRYTKSLDSFAEVCK